MGTKNRPSSGPVRWCARAWVGGRVTPFELEVETPDEHWLAPVLAAFRGAGVVPLVDMDDAPMVWVKRLSPLPGG